MNSNFADRLVHLIKDKNSRCVVGIDPIPEMLPTWCQSSSTLDGVWEFIELIVEIVAPLVPMIKPQSAYFEALGPQGMELLWRLNNLASKNGLLVLLDAKRGDIPSTSEAYAKAYLSADGFDAITVNPYLGSDSVEPFVKYARDFGKGVFVCAMTSNAGAPTLQNVLDAEGEPIFLRVAEMLQPMTNELRGASGYSGLGVVAGVTFPEQGAALRRALPDSIFLVPGIGAQGGEAEQLRGFFGAGGMGAVVSSSRAILYPHGSGSTRDETKATIYDATVQFVERVNSTLTIKINGP